MFDVSRQICFIFTWYAMARNVKCNISYYRKWQLTSSNALWLSKLHIALQVYSSFDLYRIYLTYFLTEYDFIRLIREYFLMYKYKQISITIRYVFIYTLLCNVPRKSIADFWDTYQDGCKKRTMSRDYHFYFVKKGICNSRLNMYNKIPWKEEYNGVTWVAEVKFNQI